MVMFFTWLAFSILVGVAAGVAMAAAASHCVHYLASIRRVAGNHLWQQATGTGSGSTYARQAGPTRNGPGNGHR